MILLLIFPVRDIGSYTLHKIIPSDPMCIGRNSVQKVSSRQSLFSRTASAAGTDPLFSSSSAVYHRYCGYTSSKASLPAPQIGQSQSSGTSSQFVFEATSLSGSPVSGSYSYPQIIHVYFFIALILILFREIEISEKEMSRPAGQDAAFCDCDRQSRSEEHHQDLWIFRTSRVRADCSRRGQRHRRPLYRTRLPVHHQAADPAAGSWNRQPAQSIQSSVFPP